MLDKVKDFIKENPVVAIIGGGISLFLLYLLFSRLFRRDEIPAGQPLQVIPGQRFEPPTPQPLPGEVPQWEEHLGRFEDTMRGELEQMQERLEREGRNVVFVQEIIREHLPAPVTPVTPAPVTPVTPAPITPTPTPITPAPARDDDLVRRLQADISKVEAKRRDPQAQQYFQRVWGGMDTYLASQRERLRQATE